MRLMRFLDKKDKKIKYCTVENESNFLIDGDIFSNYKVTKKKANISKILSPINPKSILCIGLNYKKHAAEGNDKIPEYKNLDWKNYYDNWGNRVYAFYNDKKKKIFYKNWSDFAIYIEEKGTNQITKNSKRTKTKNKNNKKQ